MRYLGGKSRIARRLCTALPAGQAWWEPFAGGANITQALRPVLMSDVREALASLYRAVRDGWDPPMGVTEEGYRFARTLPETDPMHGFCAAGCSYGGKWWGGYARGTPGRSYAAEARRSLLALRPHLPARIERIDFLDLCEVPTGVTAVYCDPPYAGTTGYGVAFDHMRFWSTCQVLAEEGLFVYVSEYHCPVSHRLVWEVTRDCGLQHRGAGSRTERLFRVLP